MTSARYARVTSQSTLETIKAYLPANYSASKTDAGTIIIQGEDLAGWTMDDYVLPRLASGLHFAVETGPTGTAISAMDLEVEAALTALDDVLGPQSLFGSGDALYMLERAKDRIQDRIDALRSGR